ncbi:DNA-3-methyladenine glycosylase [Crassaminicella thermophila]|uniref:Putative 3-methyladenine DNA glycosylase n=1 Tax=Crassaminicella thermophila TaxID=2599308 RepID=A0A5C0SIE9_CRATE|nr:DNA-3-methyladenine glycosylase [Crassaminicella thermophila]QEK13467.1 DNA-3-methyladenine glycosylase [Crassaminicella thermophila]
MKLGLEFYKQDALSLAKNLIGKILVRKINEKVIKCKIVETESYIGPEDKACHAYNNRRTNRTEVMFWEGGHAYVYLIYGMYNCLNIVAGERDKPEAVLIRALEPLNEFEFLKENRKIKSNKLKDLTNGPGKLCRALNITKDLNGYDLVNGDELYILDNLEDVHIVSAKRINIDYAEEYKDKLWRFYIKDNAFVSKK